MEKVWTRYFFESTGLVWTPASKIHGPGCWSFRKTYQPFCFCGSQIFVASHAFSCNLNFVQIYSSLEKLGICDFVNYLGFTDTDLSTFFVGCPYCFFRERFCLGWPALHRWGWQPTARNPPLSGSLRKAVMIILRRVRSRVSRPPKRWRLAFRDSWPVLFFTGKKM